MKKASDYQEVLISRFKSDFPFEWIVRTNKDFAEELFSEFFNSEKTPSLRLFELDYYTIEELHHEWDIELKREPVDGFSAVSNFEKRILKIKNEFNHLVFSNKLDEKYYAPDITKTNIYKTFSSINDKLDLFKKSIGEKIRDVDTEADETSKYIWRIINKLSPMFIQYTLDCIIQDIEKRTSFIEPTRFEVARDSLVLKLGTYKSEEKSIKQQKEEKNENNKERSEKSSFFDILNCNDTDERKRIMEQMKPLLVDAKGKMASTVLIALHKLGYITLGQRGKQAVYDKMNSTFGISVSPSGYQRYIKFNDAGELLDGNIAKEEIIRVKELLSS